MCVSDRDELTDLRSAVVPLELRGVRIERPLGAPGSTVAPDVDSELRHLDPDDPLVPGFEDFRLARERFFLDLGLGPAAQPRASDGRLP